MNPSCQYHGPDEDWVDPEDDEDASGDLLICPSCRREVHDETEKCPYCGDWITPVYPSGAGKRFLLIALITLLIVALLAVVL
jgi:hypothetical protein